jgi:hypothetical protein
MTSRRDFLRQLGGSALGAGAWSAARGPWEEHPEAVLAHLAPRTSHLSIACAAITWGGDDRQAMADIGALGFRGIQLRANVVPRFKERPDELRELLARQRTAIHAIRRAAGPAPDGLRARIGATLPMRRWRPAAAIAAAAAAAALVLVLLLPSGAPEAPSVAEAARLADKEPTDPPPDPQAGHDTVLARQVGGIRFPRWEPRFGWRATGERTDRLDGRRAVTVFYARRGSRIAYTIVAGRPLPAPRGARVVRDGTEFRFLGASVTWRRKGHTCVLSGRDVPAGSLLNLASWRAY